MTHKKCEHNKRKDRCEICGGSSTIKHHKDKYSCKDGTCKKSAYCEHDKIKEKKTER